MIQSSHRLAADSAAESGTADAASEQEQLFELSLDLLCVAGLDGYLRRVNPAWTRVLGWTEAELLARPVLDFVHPDDRDSTRQARVRLSRGEPLNSLENRYQCKDGSYRWLSWRSFSRPDQGTVFAVARDFSDEHELRERLKEARENAENATRAKSDFLATMSHEIRTPMNAVIGFGDLLRETNLNQEQAECVSSIQNAGTTLLEIINSVLDFSKMEAGKLEIHPQPVEVRPLIAGLFTILSPLASQRRLRFDHHVASDVPPWILADPLALNRILTNLLGNAIKFTDEGSVRLEVSLVNPDGTPLISLSVKDTGAGFSDDIISQIFQPFEQGDSSLGRQAGGTGLGLAISKSLAEAMGGTLSAESRRKPTGAHLELRVPLERVEPAPISISGHASERVEISPHLRILLVEDNRINQRLMSKLLKKLHCDCDVVDNGSQAVERAASGDYNLILMDLQMPVMDGLTATREIRRHEAAKGQASRLHIIGQTAYASLEDARRCLEAGMDAHLTKPITLASLAAHLAAVPL